VLSSRQERLFATVRRNVRSGHDRYERGWKRVIVEEEKDREEASAIQQTRQAVRDSQTAHEQQT
jgi:hypothetical protein